MAFSLHKVFSKKLITHKINKVIFKNCALCDREMNICLLIDAFDLQFEKLNEEIFIMKMSYWDYIH